MGKNIRNIVKKQYGNIAKRIGENTGNSCCGSGTQGERSCCGAPACSDAWTGVSNYAPEDLDKLPQEAKEASLGCANPLVFAGLKEGETVLDLGSGGGIDVLMASRRVGPRGRIYGLDMTDEMLLLANQNKAKTGVSNVDFVKGYIEDIPLKDGIIDVVISNCVINLSSDKKKALSEAYRVLRPGGRLAIADIVMLKDIPREMIATAALWTGCIGGALGISEYRSILEKIGFADIEIEPVHVYDRSFIENMVNQARRDGNASPAHDEAFYTMIDGAFSSARVKAVK